MTKSDLKKLRKSLPVKWAELIQKETEFSESFIRKVLYGDRHSDKIINEAIKLAQENIKIKKSLTEKIKSL